MSNRRIHKCQQAERLDSGVRLDVRRNLSADETNFLRCIRGAQLSVDPTTVGLRAPRKKIPRRPGVSNLSLGLCRSVEFSIRIVPVRSLLTKKTAPPPSLAWLFSMTEPEMVTVNRLPSV